MVEQNSASKATHSGLPNLIRKMVKMNSFWKTILVLQSMARVANYRELFAVGSALPHEPKQS